MPDSTCVINNQTWEEYVPRRTKHIPMCKYCFAFVTSKASITVLHDVPATIILDGDASFSPLWNVVEIHVTIIPHNF